jgi:hypothetical protein
MTAVLRPLGRIARARTTFEALTPHMVDPS